MVRFVERRRSETSLGTVSSIESLLRQTSRFKLRKISLTANLAPRFYANSLLIQTQLSQSKLPSTDLSISLSLSFSPLSSTNKKKERFHKTNFLFHHIKPRRQFERVAVITIAQLRLLSVVRRENRHRETERERERG